MRRPHRHPSDRRRGVAAIALVIMLALLSVAVLGLVMAGARDQDLTVVRAQTVQAMYACEAGTNMAIREIRLNTDEDGDGGIGTISDDGNDANNPSIGGGRVHVADDPSASIATLISDGVCGTTCRSASLTYEVSSTSSGMLAYGTSASTPKFRLWAGTAWGAEASANSIGATPQWIVLRGSPVDGRFALATLDNDVDIEVQIWNGSAWGSVFQATNDAGDKTTRLFDVAFEQASGDLLLVYRVSGTSNVRYRTHDGSAWSAESSLTLTSNVIKWLRLIPQAGSDQMLLVAQSDDSTTHTRCAVWNGSSFTNLSASSGASGYSGSAHADAAFESSSGQALFVVTQGGGNPGYRALSGGTWSSISNVPAVGAATLWSRLVSHASSDQILFGSLDANQDINVNSWSGAAWGTNLEVETSTASNSRRAFDLTFENGSGNALLVYDDTSSTLKYRRWNGSAWSTELSGPSGGSSPIQTVQAVSGVVSDEVLATWMMDDGAIRTGYWNGTTFNALGSVGTSGADKLYETFMIAVSAGAPSDPIITSWIAIEPQ